MKPLLVDLYGCQGGGATGYHRAGFDILGVDIKPQPHYPFPMVQADALEFLAFADLSSVAVIHASPPCHDHSATVSTTGPNGTGWLLAATREALNATGKPWVIENVPGAPMRPDLKLCGCMFQLPQLKRERWFETSPPLFEMRQPCQHRGPIITVSGSGGGNWNSFKLFGRWPTKADWENAMGIDWMTMDGLAQAIPPAYTEHIGRQLLDALRAAA